ncbi:hypothetical protein CK203_024222 [Vitis vinifera]|uniref:Uncharacterized protein n=1 Tax=Vitis vinifera TaxID=29760 RepID=A0A438I4U4_VITVI|nr:hypothetical protein CK203_024222 [Vitis vinifera]
MCRDILAFHHEDEIQYIPEEARSTIMNFFRISSQYLCVHCAVQWVIYLSLLLSNTKYWFVLPFLKVNAFPITVMFGMCSIFLFVATLLQRRLMVISESQRSSKFCNYLEDNHSEIWNAWNWATRLEERDTEAESLNI